MTSSSFSTRLTPATRCAVAATAAFSEALATGPRKVTTPSEEAIFTLWAFIDSALSAATAQPSILVEPLVVKKQRDEGMAAVGAGDAQLPAVDLADAVRVLSSSAMRMIQYPQPRRASAAR